MRRKKPKARNWLRLALAFVVGVGVGYGVFHFTFHPCINLLVMESGDTLT